ncbi:P110/LppT family adhesin N-terminal domain, partial [Mesomycoplasma ovipneumoniae]
EFKENPNGPKLTLEYVKSLVSEVVEDAKKQKTFTEVAKKLFILDLGMEPESASALQKYIDLNKPRFEPTTKSDSEKPAEGEKKTEEGAGKGPEGQPEGSQPPATGATPPAAAPTPPAAPSAAAPAAGSAPAAAAATSTGAQTTSSTTAFQDDPTKTNTKTNEVSTFKGLGVELWAFLQKSNYSALGKTDYQAEVVKKSDSQIDVILSFGTKTETEQKDSNPKAIFSITQLENDADYDVLRSYNPTVFFDFRQNQKTDGSDKITKIQPLNRGDVTIDLEKDEENVASKDGLLVKKAVEIKEVPTAPGQEKGVETTTQPATTTTATTTETTMQASTEATTVAASETTATVPVTETTTPTTTTTTTTPTPTTTTTETPTPSATVEPKKQVLESGVIFLAFQPHNIDSNKKHYLISSKDGKGIFIKKVKLGDGKIEKYVLGIDENPGDATSDSESGSNNSGGTSTTVDSFVALISGTEVEKTDDFIQFNDSGSGSGETEDTENTGNIITVPDTFKQTNVDKGVADDFDFIKDGNLMFLTLIKDKEKWTIWLTSSKAKNPYTQRISSTLDLGVFPDYNTKNLTWTHLGPNKAETGSTATASGEVQTQTVAAETAPSTKILFKGFAVYDSPTLATNVEAVSNLNKLFIKKFIK